MLFRRASFLLLFFFLIITGCPAPPAGADQSVALTIYDDFALVRDRRTFRIRPGEQTLVFPGISARIQPETALLSGAGLLVLEQDFAYDLLTRQSLLEKYLGREVLVTTRDPKTGKRSYDKAVLLSVDGGVLLRIDDRIESVRPDRIVFPRLPASLHDRPTLTMRVIGNDDSERQLQLSYLTGGLSWRADYVARLSDGGTRLDLGAWVTLKNESGTEYRQAEVQLVAGEVHRAGSGALAERVMRRPVMAAAAPVPAAGREKIFGYHLYSLPRPVTLHTNEQKQVLLLQAAGVSCRSELVLRGRGGYYRARVGEIGTRLKVAKVMELKNSAASGLGIPLPAGTVRFYSQDAAGRLQFIGEDRMDHTPEGEVARLDLGSSFDLTAEKRQVEFVKIAGTSPSGAVFESRYQITLRNGGTMEKTVRVLEEIPGDWTILAESLPHTKKDSRTAAWSVPVPAGGTAVLSYRVRVRL